MNAFAALGGAALLVVVVSAVYHRRLRVRAAHGEDARVTRRAVLTPLAVMVVAFATMWVFGFVASVFMLFTADVGGGIGSVSAGISEALVETVLMAIVAALAAGTIWASSRGSSGADRDDSK